MADNRTQRSQLTDVFAITFGSRKKTDSHRLAQDVSP